MKRGYTRWNRDRVLDRIAKLQAKGEQLNPVYVAHKDAGLLRAARKYVGGWEAAIKAAGLDYSRIGRRNFRSRAGIVEEIRAYKKAGRPLNIGYAEKSYGGLTGAANSYFGSWRKAIEAAGFDYAAIKRQREWSREIVVRELKRMRREGVNLSTTIETRKKNRNLHVATIRYFGSWRAALKSAGLEKLCRRSASRP
jgi:hypothetical protein